MKFNLIITTFRNAENDTVNELNLLLRQLGDNSPIVNITSISGLIACFTHIDPINIVKKCRELISVEPWRFRYILRIIPIEKTCVTDIRKIKETINAILQKIPKKGTYKILVEKRFSKLRTKDIITFIAKDLTNKVDLENPEWFILIEIVGKKTGVSIIEPNQIFSSVMEKRNCNS